MQPRAAVIQMVSTGDVRGNLAVAADLLGQAADAGAALAVLPENFALMPRDEAARREAAEVEGEGPVQAFLAQQSRELGLWIVGGTLPMRAADGRTHGSCLVYDGAGRQVGRYDKIHLFDVDLPDGNERYRESAHTAPGDALCVVDSPLGRLGLAVCYDLRFPELFRGLLSRGAEIIAVPSAFTAATGRAHWELLIRTRAVENLCYVLASAQGGRHDGGRETWGHSMIVEPWGGVLAQLEDGPGVALAEIDRTQQAALRQHFPALEHRQQGRNW